MLSTVWDFVLVGKTPLGSSIRGGILGAIFFFLADIFFGQIGALFAAILLVLVAMPLVYMVSHRDDGRRNWHAPTDPISDDDWTSDDHRIR